MYKMGTEKGYQEKLSCSKETKKLIINDCVEIYISYHPNLEGSNITQNHILKQIALDFKKRWG